MRRRVVWLLGFALSMLGSAASFAHAQDGQPVFVEIPGLPRVKAPGTPRPIAPVIVDVKISPNTGMPRVDQPNEQRAFQIVEAAGRSGEYIDMRYVENSRHPDDPGIWERALNMYSDQIDRLLNDYKNFYLSENLLYVGVAVGVAAPLANTHADQGIRDWYQRQAGNGRSHITDEAAKAFKMFGEYKYAIPIYLGLSFSANLFPESPVVSTVSDFGNRSLRALAVGAPAVGILQVGLGSDRPYTQDSYWHPFRSSHGASGHAFVGAIPFLTAASMTDCRPLQALLFAGSFATGWSRIHTDDHYFSQALLGWSMAYLAVQSVNQTENGAGRFRIVPCELPKGVGMGVLMQY